MMAMLAFLLIAINQLLHGAEGSQVLVTWAWLSQKLFAICLGAGAITVLISAFRLGKPGAVFERGGLIACSMALGNYAWGVPETVDHWTTSLGPTFGFMAIGCIIRAIQVHLQVRDPRNWF